MNIEETMHSSRLEAVGQIISYTSFGRHIWQIQEIANPVLILVC